MPPLATFAYTTKNIGDDVQSLAIEQILGERTKKVYRDCMWTQREEVALIANSRYLNDWQPRTTAKAPPTGQPFPPPDCVSPLYIGVALRPLGEQYMLTPEGIAHLKRFAPVGCRDQYTMGKLRQHGVDAYFSGCPTLTFENPFPGRGNTIYIVDVGSRKPRRGLFRWVPSWPNRDPDLSELIPESIVREAEFLTHFTEPDDNQDRRRARAEELIRAYCTARLVITTRLHVALPCAALGTPCLLLQRNESDVRYTGYDFVRRYDRRNIHGLDWDPDKVAVPDVAEFKQHIRHTVTQWAGRMRQGATHRAA